MATANIDIRNLQVGGLIQAGQVIDLCNIHTDGVSDGYLVTHSGDAPLSLPSSLKGKVKAWSIGGKCVQDGTPTPQSPVAIESIGTYDSESGKYEVVLEAKDSDDNVIASVSALLASPLRGIGNVTDIMDSTGAVTRGMGAVSDLGALGWSMLQAPSATQNAFSVKVDDTKTSTSYSTDILVICDYLVGRCANDVTSGTPLNGIAIISNHRLYAVVDSATCPDLATFKSVMTGAKAYYVLDTPTTETAVITGALKTTKGTTILDVDGSVKGNVEATYLSSQPMYKKLQYLQSTGTQYIDLGLTASANMEWMHKVRMPSSASNNITFGCGETSKYLYALAIESSQGMYDCVGSTFNPKYDYSYAPYLSKDVTEHMTMSNGEYTGIVECDGNTITKTGTYSTSAIPTTNGMYMLCTHHRDGSAKYNLSGRYYYLKIWKDGTLVRDLIPVRRTTDNVLGMLDKVSGQLFTNKGTGTFYSNENPPLLGLGAPLMGAMPSDEDMEDMEDMEEPSAEGESQNLGGLGNGEINC